jgi:outer membrane protein
MHRSLAIVFLGLALITAGVVTADAAAPAAGKIGFIDLVALERTLLATPAGKRASAKMEQSLKAKQTEFDKKRNDLQKVIAEFEKQRSMLKPEVAAQREQEYGERMRELQEYYVKLQGDLGNEQAKLIQEVVKQAEPVIKQVAQEQGYTMIMNRAAVVWAVDGIDITAEVNKRIK